MRLSRRIAITSPAVVIAVLIPAAVAVAMPTHPPDPASTARAIARHRAAAPLAVPTARAVASFGTPATQPVPWPDGPTWATARAVARHQVASFGPARRIAPSIASTRAAPARPDGPTWAAALVAGTITAAVAAGLGLVAGRRTVRVRTH